MIYTLTTNPSIDYYLYSDFDLIEGIQRCDQYELVVAGKGVNVSKMLAELGMQSVCIIVRGGFTGDYIVNELKKDKLIKTINIKNTQESRINVKTRFNQKEIDINTTGPYVDEKAKEILIETFDQVQDDDLVCINGSIQKDMKETIFVISNKLFEKKTKLILDIPNLTADEILSYRPYLIKPNLTELKSMLHFEAGLEEMIDKARTTFADQGINVLLSMGELGSCYITQDRILAVSPVKVQHVVNTIAAGDCMLAGYVYMLANGKKLETRLQFASAAGSASVMSSYLPALDKIEGIVRQVNVCEVEKWNSSMIRAVK